MATFNKNFCELQGGYLFSEIAKRVKDFSKKNPGVKIMRLGIGDTTRPLSPTIINGLIPSLPNEKADIIYLCSPNNPTGAVATQKQLKAFVDYALKNKAVIIFDAAYAEYILDPTLPKSIYEIE